MRQSKVSETQSRPILKEVDAGCLVNGYNGCRLAAVAFMETCATLGITQTCTSYNNPKDTADTERIMRTLKEGLFWDPGVNKPYRVGADIYRVDSVGHLPASAFSTGVSDTRSGRTAPSQPQHSGGGCVTNEERTTDAL